MNNNLVTIAVSRNELLIIAVKKYPTCIFKIQVALTFRDYSSEPFLSPWKFCQ